MEIGPADNLDLRTLTVESSGSVCRRGKALLRLPKGADMRTDHPYSDFGISNIRNSAFRAVQISIATQPPVFWRSAGMYMPYWKIYVDGSPD